MNEFITSMTPTKALLIIAENLTKCFGGLQSNESNSNKSFAQKYFDTTAKLMVFQNLCNFYFSDSYRNFPDVKNWHIVSSYMKLDKSYVNIIKNTILPFLDQASETKVCKKSMESLIYVFKTYYEIIKWRPVSFCRVCSLYTILYIILYCTGNFHEHIFLLKWLIKDWILSSSNLKVEPSINQHY